MFKFSAIAKQIGSVFTGTVKKAINSTEGEAIEVGIVSFIKTDVGEIALDAVQYASTLPAGKSSDELRAAAKAKLKTDLEAAGKDLGLIGEAMLNLFIEMAYTYASGLLTNLAAGNLKA